MDTFRTDRIREWLHNSSQPVLVEIVSDDNPACELLGPELLEVASLALGPITTLRLFLEETGPLAAEWSIHKTPALLLFVEGEQVWKYEGLLRMDQLEAAISQRLPAES